MTFFFQKSSDIVSLLEILCGVFSELPPVFSKPDPQAVSSERVTQQNEAVCATTMPTSHIQGGYKFRVFKIKVVNTFLSGIPMHDISKKIKRSPFRLNLRTSAWLSG